MYMKISFQASLQHIKEEYRIITEVEGRKITDWMETNAVIDQRDKNGYPISLVGSLLLITARKRQEEALIRAREKAQESGENRGCDESGGNLPFLRPQH